MFMEAALYDEEEGFFTSGGEAGRRGDFVTSPEIGPLYATTIAGALDRWWEELGRPDPFLVVEAGAGTGTLARDILAADPACGAALRYVLVERSARLREAQAGRLPLELPAFVLGPAAPDPADSDDDSAQPLPGRGPLVTSLAELPALVFTGVILANELLDNLPFDLLEWRDERWYEVRVAASERPGGEPLIETIVPAALELAARADRLTEACKLSDGARLPVQRAASAWLRQGLSVLERGRLVIVDYADSSPALACSPWTSWLRTFRQHQPGGHPLQSPGTQDITSVVAIDQLAAVRPPSIEQSQASWLADQGIGRFVEAARQTWQVRAATGDLEALKARSRVHEGDALTDPEGLGSFRVLQWLVG
jgi:SAM-dependent MidA family methyltransferase